MEIQETEEGRDREREGGRESDIYGVRERVCLGG